MNDAMLEATEKRYHAGATLQQLDNEFGLDRECLAALLRNRGVRLRGTAPSQHEVREMARRYAAGDSLEGMWKRLGFSPQHSSQSSPIYGRRAAELSRVRQVAQHAVPRSEPISYAGTATAVWTHLRRSDVSIPDADEPADDLATLLVSRP